MSRYFSIRIKVDGLPYTGDWQLRQGGMLCVRSAWGSETIELGGSKPEEAADKTLERIVRAYHKKRAKDQAQMERERAKFGRRRGKTPAP